MGPAVIALDTLPRDALCHITSYLHGDELLGLRCQSKHCRESIRYAAGTHVGARSCNFDVAPVYRWRSGCTRRVRLATRVDTLHGVPQTSTWSRAGRGILQQTIFSSSGAGRRLTSCASTLQNGSASIWREPRSLVARVHCWRMSNFVVGMMSAPPRAGQNSSQSCARCALVQIKGA